MMRLIERLLWGAENVALLEHAVGKKVRWCDPMVTSSSRTVTREVEIDGRWHLLQVTELPETYHPGREIKEVKL